MEFNGTTAAVSGDITAIIGNAITFTTESAFSYSGKTWMVGYRPSTSISRSNQKLYAFVAGSDGEPDWADDTGLPPFTLAP